jgi:hypothetical protein
VPLLERVISVGDLVMRLGIAWSFVSLTTTRRAPHGPETAPVDRNREEVS